MKKDFIVVLMKNALNIKMAQNMLKNKLKKSFNKKIFKIIIIIVKYKKQKNLL